MEQRLSLITLGVKDVMASRRFYEQLGWKAAGTSQETVAFFQLGGIGLALYGYTDLASDASLPGEKTGFGGIALAYNTRTLEEVDTVLAQVKMAGGSILKPGKDAVWGGYAGYFADLDGYPWEVAWNPAFPLDASGAITIP